MFSNRVDAGIQLSKKIPLYSDSIVLAVPRGGVILGEIIAKNIDCPLDVIISKKITPPDDPEYAIGAIMHDGTIYKSDYWSKFCKDPDFKNELIQKQDEVRRRLAQYRDNSKYLLSQKTVILVDDGIATGSTILAILIWIQKQNPKKIILAIPVMPKETFKKMKNLIDEIICLIIPDIFNAVGEFYDDFSQVSDAQVKIILKHYLS